MKNGNYNYTFKIIMDSFISNHYFLAGLQGYTVSSPYTELFV